MELDVFKSNNWTKYRPHFIITEILGTKSLEEIFDNDAIKYLISQNYTVVGKVFLSVFLVDNQV